MSKAKAKGTAAEREVVRYLQNWWPTAERRALSGNKDKGDVGGNPGVCIEVKAAATQLIGPWQRETLVEQANANAGACLLVVKRPYKTAARWDAYMPLQQLEFAHCHRLPGMDLEWVRMDLMLAVAVLRQLGY